MTAGKPDVSFQFPDFSADNVSLLKKHLTPELFNRLKSEKTTNGYSFQQLIHSGVVNQDSSVGVYAGDIESYSTFSELLTPIIHDYHHYKDAMLQGKDFSPLDATLKNPDPDQKYILSTRIRVARNLQGTSLGPGISREERKDVEKKISQTLLTLTGELAGQYHSLQTMGKEVQQTLIGQHLLFKAGDRFLKAAGLNRDWPEARGIFINNDRRFLVWINEEDQLRLISMEKGGDISSVFNRLARAVFKLGENLDFLFDNHLGYITSCPTNLGTAMRASVHIKLPKLSLNKALFEQTAEKLNIQIRGIHGEHTESEGGIFDISNKRRLGLTEKDCIRDLYNGVLKLISLEESL